MNSTSDNQKASSVPVYRPECSAAQNQDIRVPPAKHPRLEKTDKWIGLDARKIESHPSKNRAKPLQSFAFWLESAEYSPANVTKYNDEFSRYKHVESIGSFTGCYTLNNEVLSFYEGDDGRNALIFVKLFSESPYFKKLKKTIRQLDEIILFATADFMKGCQSFQPAVVFAKIMGAGDHYLEIALEHIGLSQEFDFKRKLPLPLLVELSEHLWDCSRAIMADPQQRAALIETLNTAVMTECIPANLESLLFMNDASACEVHQKLQPCRFMYGEELEYCTDILLMSETALSDFDALLTIWKQKLERKLCENKGTCE